MLAYFYFGSLANVDASLLWGGLVAVVLATVVTTVGIAAFDKARPVAE